MCGGASAGDSTRVSAGVSRGAAGPCVRLSRGRAPRGGGPRGPAPKSGGRDGRSREGAGAGSLLLAWLRSVRLEAVPCAIPRDSLVPARPGFAAAGGYSSPINNAE